MNTPRGPVAEDCRFCEYLPDPQTAFQVAELLEDGDILVKPGLGMQMPGYFLTITPEHVTSFAQLDTGRLARIDEAVTEFEDKVGPLFGTYFRVEHGSDNITVCGAGACMEHAHQHEIPGDDIGSHILKQLPWKEIGKFENLADFAGEPYIYLGHAGMHYVVANPALPGQWARRQVAQVRGLDSWDWALEPGNQELSDTHASIARNIPGRYERFKSHPLVLEHLAKYPPQVIEGDNA